LKENISLINKKENSKDVINDYGTRSEELQA